MYNGFSHVILLQHIILYYYYYEPHSDVKQQFYNKYSVGLFAHTFTVNIFARAQKQNTNRKETYEEEIRFLFEYFLSNWMKTWMDKYVKTTTRLFDLNDL